jgi:DNA-binding response OmpR family regulator
VKAASDGLGALAIVEGAPLPELAVLDWMMPGMDGPEVCRRLRGRPDGAGLYIILLTAKTAREDIVTGLEAGADDYITKPFDRDELKARLRVGERVVDLQRRLADRVRALEDALANVRQLQGLLPICSYCKKVRDDSNYWQQVEQYMADRTDLQFSHSICPSCYEQHVKPELDALRRARATAPDAGNG